MSREKTEASSEFTKKRCLKRKPKPLPPHIFSDVSLVSVVLPCHSVLEMETSEKNHLKKAPLPRVLELRSFFSVNQLTSRARRLHVLTHLIQRVLGFCSSPPIIQCMNWRRQEKPFEGSSAPTCPAASTLLLCQSADDLKSTMTSCHNISEKLRRPYEDILPMDSINFFHLVLGSLDVQKHFRETKQSKVDPFEL